MAAIIRVKRRLSEEPASSLVVSLKRSKPDEASSENGGDCDAATSNKRLFAFAGTVTQKVRLYFYTVFRLFNELRILYEMYMYRLQQIIFIWCFLFLNRKRQQGK